MRQPTLFDVFTLGIFWRLDNHAEIENQRKLDEGQRKRDRAEELDLKRREVEALEKLVRGDRT